ncbi:unnamed protein product [Rhizoctonia solani]|uniref:Uncharacterized protein n=1 Tax=Rhizoctonia solani TaxID=456999 RepID=A0A8H3HRD8_9AGAM|nr:unnamed protein product [Rhizoctonia solani]
MATKNLNFYAQGLQKDITITLVFDAPPSRRLFKNFFPVVWKVIELRAGGHAKASIVYNPRLAFGCAQIDQDNLVDSAPWVELKRGDISTISGGPGQRQFGENTRDDNSKLLVCMNDTGDPVDLSLGLVKGNGVNQSYAPTFVWTGVDAGSDLPAIFDPTLTAYVTRDYKETELLRGEIEADVIWTRDLDELDDVTGWTVVEDEATGAFSIEEAVSV